MIGRLLVVILFAALAVPEVGSAQMSRLDGRVDARMRAAVGALVDSARAAGLPTEPLISKTLEGISRGYGASTLPAVRALAQRLATAREVLGPRASTSDLMAAASAIHAGVPTGMLRDLRTARPDGPVAVVLVVLADLIARGVPSDTASGLVLALATAQATDEAYVELRRRVVHDIASGQPPVIAATTRALGVLSVGGPVATEAADVGGLNATGGTRGRKPTGGSPP